MSNKEYINCLSQMLMAKDKDEFKKGADNFEKLENDMLDSFEDFDHGKILHQLLTEKNIENIENMIMLLELFSKYQFQPFITDSLAQFLKNNAKNFQKQPILAEFIQIISTNVYLQSCGNHANLGSAIVEVLSWIQVPNDSLELNKFYKDLRLIENFLRDLCKINYRQSADGLNCFSACLQTLYYIISDTNRTETPCPALVIVLQLFYENVQNLDDLSQQVRSKATDKNQFMRVIFVLCTWLVKLKDNYRYLICKLLGSFVNSLKLEEKTELAHFILPEVFNTWIESINFHDEKIEEKCFFFSFVFSITSLNVYHILITGLSEYIFEKNQSNEINRDQSEEDKIDMVTKFFSKYVIPIITEKNPRHIHIKCPHCQHYLRTIHEWSLERKKEDNNIITREDAKNIMKNSTIGRSNYLNLMPKSSQTNSCKVGLYNLGNTCYMNSVLQALGMTRQLCHEILLYKSLNNLQDQTILKKLQNLFALLKYSHRSALKPYEILSVSRPAYFMPGHQQDSSEFLCHLLDVLYEQEKSVINQCNSNDQGISMKPNSEDKQVEETEEATPMEISPIDDDEDEPMPGIKRWTTEENLSEGLSLQRKTQSLADFTQGDDLAQTQQLSDSHSDSTDSGIQSVGGEDATAQLFLVHKVFGGELKVTYQCMQCNTQSHNTDKFRDLQLCFKEETPKIIEVQDLLNCYLQPEFLKDDNKYRCDKCMKLCDAKRWTTILQAPAHLILTLKHFQFNPVTRLRTKLSHKVEYNETIKLPISNATSETYHLYAAVVHSGVSMDYGHYFTYACDSKKKWYKFNDSYVSETTLQDFKRLHPPDTPYILFYKKNSVADTFEEDSPSISTLSKTLQDYIAIDIEENKREYSKKSFPTAKYFPVIRKDSDDDDDNNSSSRGLFRADEFIGSQGFAH